MSFAVVLDEDRVSPLEHVFDSVLGFFSFFGLGLVELEFEVPRSAIKNF